MNKIYATSKGFITTEEILKIAKKKSVYKLSNRDYEIGDEDEDKYMMQLYNPSNDYIIIRFDNSRDSDILYTTLKNNYNGIQKYHIDFYNIRRELEDQKHEEWKKTITDTRLNRLLNEVNTRYEKEYRSIFTSLQESLEYDH